MSSGKWRPCCRSLNVLNPYATLLLLWEYMQHLFGNLFELMAKKYPNPRQNWSSVQRIDLWPLLLAWLNINLSMEQ